MEITEAPFNVVRSSGEVLQGFITAPASQHEHKYITIWMHGTISEYNHNFTSDLANKLAKDHGIMSYRFNLRFDSTEKEPDHRYRFCGFDDDIDDMMCVVRALKSAGYEPWGLIGHSRGANDALIYASRYHSSIYSSKNIGKKSSDSIATLVAMMDNLNGDSGGVHSNVNEDTDDAVIDVSKLVVVSIAPRFDMKRMPECIFSPDQLNELEASGKFIWNTQRGSLAVTREDVDVVKNQMDMEKIIKSIPLNVPVLILHGTDDELIPVEDAHSFKKARTGIDSVIIEGARHAFRGKKQLKQLLNVVSTWLGAKVPIKDANNVVSVVNSSDDRYKMAEPLDSIVASTVVVEDSSRSVCKEIFPRCSFSRPNPKIEIT